jgi:hypothetical protein
LINRIACFINKTIFLSLIKWSCIFRSTWELLMAMTCNISFPTSGEKICPCHPATPNSPETSLLLFSQTLPRQGNLNLLKSSSHLILIHFFLDFSFSTTHTSCHFRLSLFELAYFSFLTLFYKYSNYLISYSKSYRVGTQTFPLYIQSFYKKLVCYFKVILLLLNLINFSILV